MTNNPWDDLNKSNKNKSDTEDSSVSDFLRFFDKKKDNKNNSFSSCENDSDFISGFNEVLNKFHFKFRIKKNFQLFIVVVISFVCFWLLSGFYTIRQEESAIIMRFGKYVRDESAGLHYHLPYPIEEVVKEQTTRVRILKIGGDNTSGSNRELGEGWALTGDENIVNLELNVQWKIDDLKKFIFGVRDKEQTIYDATQSAIREVISKRKLADILTSGRKEIEEETKELLQQMLYSYDMGVNVIVVQMLKIDPPAQVIDSFRDVQTARVDKESEINKAYKYRNDILPKVKGEAGKIIEDANGYAIAVVNRAKGEASKFNQVYEQYKNAPLVTRKRMYLEAMEEILSKNKAIIVDENVKNVFIDGKDITNDKKMLINSSVLDKSEE